MNVNKIFKLLALIFVTAIIGISFFIIYKNQNNKQIKIDKGNYSCITEEQLKVVAGNSLHGIIEDEEKIKILKNYYNCNEVKRNDIINYQYSANKNPIIKIVKAVPCDTFKIIKNKQEKYNIYVNNKILTISTGEPYELNENKKKMLALYEKNYQGKIPQNNYLILGNSIEGTLDSTTFGLVNKNEIIGKVIINNN